MTLKNPIDGLSALRELFHDAEVDALNFVLFSTSGVHGTYNTIEEAEKALLGDEECCANVTFLVVHPGLVALRYGTCTPETVEDIKFLKDLRANSWEVMGLIGASAE